jgi:tetratricopeptide (TPR) repeat protein
MNRRLLMLGLVVLVVIAYWPSLRGGFLWDDDDHLTKNPAVNSAAGLPQIWSSLAVSRYYPLTLTTFWVERHVWGLNPLPFRVVNVAVHALNALLLFALLSRLKVPGAWVAAALWAVHPVNVESVAWITELKNTQSFFFFLLCLHCYLSFDEKRRAGWYALAILACAAAFTSKPSTVTLPAILLLLVWWQRREWQWREVWPTLPFFAMAAGMSLLTIIEQHRHVVSVGTNDWQIGLAGRVIVAGRALWFYAGKLFWPVNLVFVYPRWEIRPESVLAWWPVAAVLLAAGALYRWRRTTIGFGLAIFVLALLPVLGLIDIYYFRFSFVADHFNYIGSAAFLALVAAGLARLRRPTVLAAVLIGALTLLSWRHAHAFQSDEQLWTDTVEKNPSAFIAHCNLGGILYARGQPDAAIAHVQEALRLRPTYWEPWMELGRLSLDTGDNAKAIDSFKHALQYRPDFVDARYGLGLAYFKLGQWAEARAEFEAAAKQQPQEGRVQLWLGDIAIQQGRSDDAVQAYERAILIDPMQPAAFLKLGRLRRERGETERAKSCFQRVLQLHPGDPEAQSALAAMQPPASHS